MKRYLLTCLIAVSTYTALQAQIIVQSGSNIVIKGGATLYVGGLTLNPSSDFTITSTLNRTTAISNPHPDPTVARAYQFANTTNAYSGTIRIHYQDAELNGLPEANLAVSVYNGTLWQSFVTASKDVTSNYVVSNSFSGVPLKEVTLVSPPTILPISFLNAAAFRRTGGVQVNWKVGDQTSTNAYEVERSTDGIHFIKVYTVAALRMVASGYTYNWLDAAPPSGTIYYRVKANGLNGNTTYSSILKIAPVNTPGAINISPNPIVGNLLNLQLVNGEAGKYTIRIMHINGQVLYTTTLTHAGGSLVQQLRLPNISKGTYELQIEKPDHTREIKPFISE
jgi:hypothetical protein